MPNSSGRPSRPIAGRTRRPLVVVITHLIFHAAQLLQVQTSVQEVGLVGLHHQVVAVVLVVVAALVETEVVEAVDAVAVAS